MRHIYMQAVGRLGSNPRLRAVAAILACVLGLTLVTAAHSSHGHTHGLRGSAVLVTATTDSQHLTARGGDHSVLGTTPATAASLVAWPSTADSSTPGSWHTAHTPPVRGPPAQAPA